MPQALGPPSGPEPHGPGSGPFSLATPPAKGVLDPVCGMTVRPETAARSYVYKSQTYYFCNPGCRQKFQADPEKYLQGGPSSPMQEHPSLERNLGTGAGVQYVCPMDPEVVSDKPGSCPKCGMALEPRTVAAEEGASPELADMR